MNINFDHLVNIYNHDHYPYKDKSQVQIQYNTLFNIITYLSLTKQLARRWIQNKQGKTGVYKPSNDLSQAILSEPFIYSGNEECIHLYKKSVSQQACESKTETDVNQYTNIMRGKYHLRIDYAWMIKVIKESMPEFAMETKKKLKEMSIDLLGDPKHLSPIMKQCPYKNSKPQWTGFYSHPKQNHNQYL